MSRAYIIPYGELSGVIFFPPTVQTFGPRAKKQRRLSKIFFLLFALFILSSPVLYACATEVIQGPLWTVFETRPQVTGVLYDADNPLAIISGKVVRQGETVGGYLVANIRPDGVELVKAPATM